MDNVFVERLWRSLEYEEVYLHAYDHPAAARTGIGGWIDFCNHERPHQALNYRTPAEKFANKAAPVYLMDNAGALSTTPQAQQPQQVLYKVQKEGTAIIVPPRSTSIEAAPTGGGIHLIPA